MARITDEELGALGLKLARPDHPIYKVGRFEPSTSDGLSMAFTAASVDLASSDATLKFF